MIQIDSSLVDLIAISILIPGIFGGMGWVISMAWRDHRQKKRDRQPTPPKLASPFHPRPSPRLRTGIPTVPLLPINALRMALKQSWREIREIPDPVARVLVGGPLLFWALWDTWKRQWLIRRLLKMLARDMALIEESFAQIKKWAEERRREEEKGKDSDASSTTDT